VLTIVLAYGVAFVSFALLDPAPHTLRLSSGHLTAILCAYAPFFLVGITLLPYAAHRRLRDLGLRRPSLPVVLTAFGAAVAMFVLAQTATAIAGRFMHDTSGADSLRSATDPGLIAGFGFVTIVAAPITEELLFRGFLLNALSRYLPFSAAAVLSSVAFAFIHDAGSVVPVFVVGLVLAVVYHRTGSLIAAIIAHGTFNAFAVILSLVAGKQ
jgi:membrane protease YdiL (CAAX protease family)